MKKSRREELIHAEIDGLISESDRSELRQALKEYPEARELHSDMIRIAGAIDRVDQAEPPEGLRQSILDTIASRANLAWVRPKRPHRTAALLKYSAALAAGLVLGLVVAPLLNLPAGSLNPSEMGGSMIPEASPRGAHAELTAIGVQGTVRLDRADGQAVVNLELETQGLVEIILGYDAASTSLAGLTRDGGEFESIEASVGRVALEGSGTLSVSVAFDRWEPGAVEVFVTVIYSGKTVHEGKLSLDDGPSGF